MDSFIESKAGYSKLVGGAALGFDPFVKVRLASTVRNRRNMAEWPLPQSCAQLIW